jgi:cytochrome b subunit of formate dehydrogenase
MIAGKEQICFGIAALLIFFLNLGAACAQSPTKDVCLGCHGFPGLEKTRDGKTISLQIDKESFERSIHGAFDCTACHNDVTQVPHKSELKPAQCDGCHAASVKAYTQSIHAKARAEGFTEPPTCSSCHGNIHKIVPRADIASPVNPKNIAATCAACHGDALLTKKFHIPVVRPVEAYLQSVHARAVAAGKPGAVCSDCHGSHAVFPASDPRSPIWWTNVPQTCGKCHKDILAAYGQSIHGQAAARGARDAPVCTDCHGEHRILSPQAPNSPVFAANIPVETCGRCHGSARMSEKYGLALDKLPSFEDSYHGLALREGRLTVANCSSCHGVHDILPSSDPRSSVAETNLPKTCGQCHPGAGTRFALGPVHVSSENSRAVYWIRLVYLWVIFVTIGLMAAHNLLDFIRKARAERAAPPLPEIPPRERMTRPLRWQHGLVVLSFTVLAYTGFALKYPDGWWAAPLLRWEGQFALRRLLHRAAAVVLISALAWHLIQLMVSPSLRVKLRRLKFALKDFRDCIALQRYNLGLSPKKPHFGKFSYIEKTEYWAFMWGMVLMSSTGLILWFANLTLSFLPKWVSDVATAIHFYEAVLATLAILVWHFYWVIFDPDVYPMDASWWHGRPPAARRLERQGDDAAASLAQSEPGESSETEVQKTD